MWSHLTLLLIVGVAVTSSWPDNEHEHVYAWQRNKDYHYHVQSQTLAGLDKLKKQYSGFFLKGDLKLQVTSAANVVRAALINPQIARLHGVTTQSCCSDITDILKPLEYESDENEVEYLEYYPISTLSGLPFELHLKHGVIRDVLVNESVPIWEINLLKSIVSQLQLDTEGENMIKTKGTQIPLMDEHSSPMAMFSTMEDSVGGKCEVLYDIMPLSEMTRYTHPELVPLPDVGSGNLMDIIKTKNYSRCTEESLYYFGTDGKSNKDESKPLENIIERSSRSRVVILGNLKQYTIQSACTTSNIYVSPQLNSNYIGNVYSKVNLTLVSMTERQTPKLSSLTHPVSTGHLVYLYNDLFSGSDEYKPRYPSVSRTSKSSENFDSSRILVVSDSSDSKEKPFTNPSSLRSILSRPETDNKSSKSSEDDFVRYGLKMDDLSKSPVLPLYVNLFSDKSDSRLTDSTLVTEAKLLAEEIADDLYTRKDILSRGTLEKYMILINMVRLMDILQIIYLQQHDFTGWKAQYFESVLYDAITQAGTGPALLTLKKWITDGKVRNWEAAQAISRIPKVARLPTPEYIKEVFEMIKAPILQEQPFVNSTAPFAFAELIYNAEVSETKRKTRYPVEMMSSMLSNNNSVMIDTYIPYLATQLRKAFEDQNRARIQTYTLALGKTGHPEILSIFEPYLEGKLPTTKHQRLMIVASLVGLAENAPKLARSVLYKIYSNPEEAHEIRCSALFHLMKTDPPLTMLERIAQYTNYDSDANVNSAAKTMIENLAELKNSPEWGELSKKAYIAKRLLTPKEYNYKTSQGHIIKNDDAVNILRNIYTITMETIGSSDSELPKALYIVNPIEDVVGHPKTEVAYALSSIKEFFEKIKDFFRSLFKKSNKDSPSDTDSPKETSPVEEIARMLNMKPQVQDPLEGSLIWNSMYGSHVYAIDNNGVTMMLNKLKQMLRSTIKKDHNYLFSYDLNLHVATETGMPFTYILQKPMLLQVQVKATPQTRRNLRQEDQALFLDSLVLKNSNAVHLTLASKTMTRFGFVTPFDSEHYLAGVDTDMVVDVPFTYDLQFNLLKSTTHLALRPNTEKTESLSMHRVFQYSNVPFTSRYSLLYTKPVKFNKNTRIVRVSDGQFKTRMKFGGLTVRMESDNKVSSNDLWSFVKKTIMGSSMYKVKFETLDLTIDPLGINIVHSKKKVKSDTKLKGPWEENTWEFTSQLKTLTSAEERNEAIIKEISNSVQDPTVQALDFTVDDPITQKKYIVTLGTAKSDDNLKYETLIYGQTVKNQHTDYEVCSAAYVFVTPTRSLDFNETLIRRPETEFHFDLLNGETCATGSKFEINGILTRTQDLKEKIMKSDVASQCREEMERGNKMLQACQEAIALANMKNHMMMSIRPIESSMQLLAMVMPKRINIMTPVEHQDISGKKEAIEMEVKVLPDLKYADVKVYTPIVSVDVPSIDITNLHFMPMIKKKVEQLFDEDSMDVTCTIDKDQALTFDGRMYPLGKLGKCQHVMMTASLQQNSDDKDSQPKIPSNHLVAVTVEDLDNEKKKLLVVLGETKIELEKPNDRVNIVVDKQNVSLSESYIIRRNNEIIAEITDLVWQEDKAVILISRTYGIQILFDGKHIRVDASSEYRDSVRGLCGNYDGQPDNDFMTPQNCIMSKPEHFVAMYALTENNCKGPALENKMQAEQATCILNEHRLSNVISDREAGRPMTENKYWGRHWKNVSKHICTLYRIKTILNDHEICFSTKPLMMCTKNCISIRTKLKSVPVVCLPKTNSARQLMRTIEQGAHPDMSQLKISRLAVFELPLNCIPA